MSSSNEDFTPIAVNFETLATDESVISLVPIVKERDEGGANNNNPKRPIKLVPTAVTPSPRQVAPVRQAVTPLPDVPRVFAAFRFSVFPVVLIPVVPVPQPSLAAAWDWVTVKHCIAANAFSLIQDTTHSEQKKSWTEVRLTCPFGAHRSALFHLLAGFSPAVNTVHTIRWNLVGSQVTDWLLCPRHVHPVKYKDQVKYWCVTGMLPLVYAWAALEKVEVTYEKHSHLLKLKFRTCLAGTGMPVPTVQGPPTWDDIRRHVLQMCGGEEGRREAIVQLLFENLP
jgi:hypothetical protein